ncbi:hypothetical protein B0T17DRAFT_556280 [Bombardia bombarda]|uniref:Signal recognition particle subunit SRP68 n=1 Tax=Bombardia bombarda TaxID=252184 RepID=A0AA40C9C4_9PEZI|nr:hypothetical protein B0T17DRAFT_556280 [Bombardia bombarda]
MDITKFIVSSREKALLYGDHATYRSQLAGKLLHSRKKLNIATKNRGKFSPKVHVTPEQIAENHEYLRLQLLTAERAWAHAMSMKAAHSADKKGMTGKTRSHIVSRLEKGARYAEKLAETLSQTAASGATPTDVLEAHAYAALLRGAAQFEKQHWESCLKSYSVARIIYGTLSTSAKGDIFKDLLSETIDPSIRYAAYQAKIPRTQPIPAIAHKAFLHADAGLVERIKSLNPDVLKAGGGQEVKEDAVPVTEAAPTTLTWRSREVKIEDAAIAAAWASVATEKSRLSQKLSSGSLLLPNDMAAAYDDILTRSQDAVDATKQAIDELKSEGVTQSDPRMQSLQITRTAVNYELISWRIGRNRVLIGKDDGAHPDFGEAQKKKKKTDVEEVAAGTRHKDEAPGRQIARLKEKVVLYDGTLQSLEAATELPGVANDQELSSRLNATAQYFTALKCLAISRSHSIAGNDVNALALIKHALGQCKAALPVLSGNEDEDDSDDEDAEPSPRNILVTKQDIQLLHDLLSGEQQRSRALVEIHSLEKSSKASSNAPSSSSKPLVSQLSSYPAGGIDLENIVAYPPRVEAIPVKPIFLDVAWNYIDYPGNQAGGGGPKQAAATTAGKAGGAKKPLTTAEQQQEEAAKPQKRGWFGFGR